MVVPMIDVIGVGLARSIEFAARKVGLDDLIQVYIGFGHPIQTWARAVVFHLCSIAKKEQFIF
jgi:hypothetical protein